MIRQKTRPVKVCTGRRKRTIMDEAKRLFQESFLKPDVKLEVYDEQGPSNFKVIPLHTNIQVTSFVDGGVAPKRMKHNNPTKSTATTSTNIEEEIVDTGSTDHVSSRNMVSFNKNVVNFDNIVVQSTSKTNTTTSAKHSCVVEEEEDEDSFENEYCTGNTVQYSKKSTNSGWFIESNEAKEDKKKIKSDEEDDPENKDHLCVDFTIGKKENELDEDEPEKIELVNREQQMIEKEENHNKHERQEREKEQKHKLKGRISPHTVCFQFVSRERFEKEEKEKRRREEHYREKYVSQKTRYR